MPDSPACLLVSNPTNIRYLAGCADEGDLLIWQPGSRGKRILIVSPLHAATAREQARAGVRVVPLQSGQSVLRAELERLGVAELGFEAEQVSVARLAQLKKILRGIRLVPTTGRIVELRRAKSAAEIEKIEKACAIGDRVLRSILPAIRRGVTELELAENIRAAAFRFGAEGLAFDSIVAFGENSAIPHARPSRRKLKKGDLIQFDLGVRVGGYCSDMSRVFFTAEPDPIQKAVFDAVLAAQLAGVAAVQPNIPASQVDAACRGSLARAGLEPFFIHSTGHGVGLDIHEWPAISPHSSDSLASGNVITVEPGVYLDGQFGMRIEDTVAVGRSGGQILTRFPKMLAILQV